MTGHIEFLDSFVTLGFAVSVLVWVPLTLSSLAVDAWYNRKGG